MTICYYLWWTKRGSQCHRMHSSTRSHVQSNQILCYKEAHFSCRSKEFLPLPWDIYIHIFWHFKCLRESKRLDTKIKEEFICEELISLMPKSSGWCQDVAVVASVIFTWCFIVARVFLIVSPYFFFFFLLNSSSGRLKSYGGPVPTLPTHA